MGRSGNTTHSFACGKYRRHQASVSSWPSDPRRENRFPHQPCRRDATRRPNIKTFVVEISIIDVCLVDNPSCVWNQLLVAWQSDTDDRPQDLPSVPVLNSSSQLNEYRKTPIFM